MVTLFPNFGAEEFFLREKDDVDFIGRVQKAPFTALAKAWQCLYAEAAVLGINEATERYPNDALEHLPQGDVPWLQTKFHPGTLGKASVVKAFSDKAFALSLAKARRCPLSAISEVAQVCPLPKEGFTLKPRFGSSGRGRVPLDSSPTRIESGFARLQTKGGALLEPWVERRCDLSAQGIVHDEVALWGTTRLEVTPSGRVLGLSAHKEGELYRAGTAHDEEVLQSAKAVGRLLLEAGYRGPFGVDAFSYEHKGRECLRVPVEINPRFTMGTIAIGLAERHSVENFYFGGPKTDARVLVDFGALVLCQGEFSQESL